MSDTRTTMKGYTLTAGQMSRIFAIQHLAVIGPGYVRGVRDNLSRLNYAEDAEGVDYFLTRAEACVPGAPVICEIIRTVEPV